MIANDLLTVDTETDLKVMVSSSTKASAKTVEAYVSDGNNLEAIRRSFNSLPAAASSKLFAFHVLLRLEYGGPAILPRSTTEMDTWNVCNGASRYCGIGYEGSL